MLKSENKSGRSRLEFYTFSNRLIANEKIRFLNYASSDFIGHLLEFSLINARLRE